MEMLKINNKDNLINSYGLTPTLPYDIEGKLIEKNGKDIKVEKIIDNKTVKYSLRLKQEIVGELGDNITVEKENIVSAKVEEKEDIAMEEKSSRKVSDILMELGLEHTEKNIRMIEFLLKNGIKITKGNVDSYLKSREYLNKIIEELDPNSYIKLMNRGIDLEEENLQKIAEVLDEVKNEKTPLNIRKFLKIDRELTYKEAEEIAEKVYGQKMGKDVYDTIIALHKEKVPITKENIDKVMEVVSKLNNLKSLKPEVYIKIINEDINFNIDNLYILNNSYTVTNMGSNLEGKRFEEFTIIEKTNIENLKKILMELEIEDKMENIMILREFIVKDMTIDIESYDEVISMKEALIELRQLLGTSEIVRLNKKDINLLKEDIFNILDIVKKEDNIENQKEEIIDKEGEKIIKDLENLGSIKYKDLLYLIKNNKDFNLNSIKEIFEQNTENNINLEYKTLNKTIHISNIFNTLGESLNPNVLAITKTKYDLVTLDNLYNAQKQINDNGEIITPIRKIEENILLEEYIKAKHSLTLNMIKISVKEEKDLEHMELNELNNFIEKKLNRYKEVDRLTKEIKDIKREEDKIIPIIMKNNLPMNLKEIKDINLLLNGEKNIANLLKEIMDPQNQQYNEEIKEGLKLIQENISQSIKNGEASFKDHYKDMINSLNTSSDSSDFNNDENKKKEYLNTIKKISQKDLIMQLPIKIDNEYKSLNLIIPDINRGLDKNNMDFYISIETDNLGRVGMELNVKGRDIYINIEEEGNALNNNIHILEQLFNERGYTLHKGIKQVVI